MVRWSSGRSATSQQAQASVVADRQQLGAIAVGSYTGQLTNPQPSGSPTPQADQQAAIDLAEVTRCCDSCSSGWQFPSPSGGVTGQIQLLRIFATSSSPPPGAPGPVLPSLTAAQQHEAGCCASVESLTGVWATDPSYGSQILTIYQSMLGFALPHR